MSWNVQCLISILFNHTLTIHNDKERWKIDFQICAWFKKAHNIFYKWNSLYTLDIIIFKVSKSLTSAHRSAYWSQIYCQPKSHQKFSLKWRPALQCILISSTSSHDTCTSKLGQVYEVVWPAIELLLDLYFKLKMSWSTRVYILVNSYMNKDVLWYVVW